MRRLVAIGTLLVGFAVPAAAQSDRFVGTWVSSGGEFINVTTMRADGTFHTDRWQGVEVLGTIDGKWAVRGDAIAWTYLKPPAAADDVNPIVSATANEFTLRETDGSQSTFFRKGVVDPASPELLPVAVGTGWILEDENGEVAIRISVREKFAGQDCYRVEWIEGPFAYQSELWAVRDDGIWVVGRRVLGRELPFKAPYLLLKRNPAAGDKWNIDVTAGAFSMKATVQVGAEEEVKTPAGSFRAVRVSLEGDVLAYRRWYARGVGLVREEPIVFPGAGEKRIGIKALKRRIE